MEKIFYTEDHFWVSIENDVATVGITEKVLNNFNMISFIDLPQNSIICSQTELIGDIIYDENKHFELYSPFSGEILKSNELLIDRPEQMFNYDQEINWLFKMYITSPEEVENLMNEEEYQEYIEGIL